MQNCPHNIKLSFCLKKDSTIQLEVGALPAGKCITCIHVEPHWTHLLYLWLSWTVWHVHIVCTHCAHWAHSAHWARYLLWISYTVWHVHIVHIWARYLLWISRRRHACTWLVLSSSTTTLAIFAHSLIPWPPHSGLFHRFRTHQWDPWDSQWAVGFNVAIENRDIPQFRAIDRSAREPICLFMRSARLRWLAAKKPVDRRRILDSVKLRAKRSPGQGKCGYVRRVVSRGDWLQHMQNSTDNRMNRKTKFSES